jgi:hypothetical protein
MLRPKVSEVLNERSRNHGNAHLFGCSWKITLALLGYCHFGIRIGSMDWVGLLGPAWLFFGDLLCLVFTLVSPL